MPTNEERAEWAAHALDEYGLQKEGDAEYDNPEDMAADLICDLLHLIAAHCDDKTALQKLAMAQTNYEAERDGDEFESKNSAKRK